MYALLFKKPLNHLAVFHSGGPFMRVSVAPHFHQHFDVVSLSFFYFWPKFVLVEFLPLATDTRGLLCFRELYL